MQDSDRFYEWEKHPDSLLLFIIYNSLFVMSYTSAPVIDLLIQIKNAYMVRKTRIDNVMYSTFKATVCQLLQRAKFIHSFEIIQDGNKKSLQIELLQTTNMNEAVPNIKLFSKPSRRYYVGYEEIQWVAWGKWIGIISTDKGLMFTHEAKAQKLWWELIAEMF